MVGLLKAVPRLEPQAWPMTMEGADLAFDAPFWPSSIRLLTPLIVKMAFDGLNGGLSRVGIDLFYAGKVL